MKIVHSVLRAIAVPPHNLPPLNGTPSSISPQTLIIIFYYFYVLKMIDARQHYKFRTTVFAPVTPP